MKHGRAPLTLSELQKRFSDPETCLAFLEKARWPDGPVCLSCGGVNHASRITTLPGRLTCLDCGRPLSKALRDEKVWNFCRMAGNADLRKEMKVVG